MSNKKHKNDKEHKRFCSSGNPSCTAVRGESIIRNRVEMRIAQVAPLYESVPPKLYGGTERVVHYLTEELIRQGNDVTLFASGDSVTSARLIAPCKTALRLDPNCKDPLAYHILALEEVMESADEFDVVHFHIDYIHFPFSKRHSFAHVTTLHGRLDMPELPPMYRKFHDIPVVSLSDAQRRPVR